MKIEIEIEDAWMDVPEKFFLEEGGIDMNEAYVALKPLSLLEVQDIATKARRAGSTLSPEIVEHGLEGYKVSRIGALTDGERRELWITVNIEANDYDIYFDAETEVEDLLAWIEESRPEIGAKAVVGVCGRGHPQIQGVTRTWKRCRPCQNEYARARMQDIEPDWSRADQAAREMIAGTWIPGTRNLRRLRAAKPEKKSLYEWDEE